VEHRAPYEVGAGNERDGEPDGAPRRDVTASEADGPEELGEVVRETALVVEDERRASRTQPSRHDDRVLAQVDEDLPGGGCGPGGRGEHGRRNREQCDYPQASPPPDVEPVVVGAGAGVATACLTNAPAVLTTYHSDWNPWPAVWPAALSPAKK